MSTMDPPKLVHVESSTNEDKVKGTPSSRLSTPKIIKLLLLFFKNIHTKYSVCLEKSLGFPLGAINCVLFFVFTGYSQVNLNIFLSAEDTKEFAAVFFFMYPQAVVKPYKKCFPH